MPLEKESLCMANTNRFISYLYKNIKAICTNFMVLNNYKKFNFLSPCGNDIMRCSSSTKEDHKRFSI
jgi:hypothetical protein